MSKETGQVHDASGDHRPTQAPPSTILRAPLGMARPSGSRTSWVQHREINKTGGCSRRLSLMHMVRKGSWAKSSLRNTAHNYSGAKQSLSSASSASGWINHSPLMLSHGTNYILDESRMLASSFVCLCLLLRITLNSCIYHSTSQVLKPQGSTKI